MSHDAEEGRPYVHKKCGQVTVISGSDFVGLCNPFEPCMGTICASCGGPDSTSQFAWADTEESISDYRARLRAAAPASLKIWNYVISPLVGAGVGGIVGAMLDPKNPLAGGSIGAAVGALVMFFFIGPKITGVLGAGEFYRKR